VRPFLALLLAAGVTLAVIAPLRALAMRWDIMDRPGPRKSHSRPVPYLGGLAVLAGAGAGALLFQPSLWRALALLALIAGLGLYDDLRKAAVVTKLVAEITIAAAAVALGFVWHLTDSAPINVGLSMLWMVGMCNSFNMLDNMDGLSSTLAAASLLALTLIVTSVAPLAAPLAGAALGFLVVNRPPARMYLGDAGSLTLGFAVALVSILAANSAHGLHSVVLLVLPVGVALFDTTLVIASRLAAGRPVQLGGRDHFSHRLRLLGWSPVQVLMGALAASAAGGLLAYLANLYPLAEAWLAVPIGFAYLAVWLRLLRVDPYIARVLERDFEVGSG
jgi:UDP-GlcNAc:undecaprenyl-phosphate GlcNAc-1-phosphate transferase